MTLQTHRLRSCARVMCRLLQGWLCVLALAVLLVPTPVRACGLPLEARLPAEQALIVFEGGRQEIITTVTLDAAEPEAAIIFPVPAAPEVSVLADDSVFDYLADATAPEVRFEQRWCLSDAGETAGSAPGVELLGREVLGNYDVARLAAGDAAALGSWFEQNGYTVPQAAQPILQSYIDEGWAFVAVRLAPGHDGTGAITPLRITFESDEIVYPMRLGALAGQPFDVQVYVLADRRVTIEQMETLYAGPVAELTPRPPEAVAGLLRAPYLTRLRNSAVHPADITGDFVARAAASNEPFRPVIERSVCVVIPELGAIGSAIVLAALISLLALGVAIWIRRRIDAIAPERSTTSSESPARSRRPPAAGR